MNVDVDASMGVDVDASVTVDTTDPRNWRKSSYSGHEGDCVEVAWYVCRPAIRDSKRPAAAHLQPTPDAWSTFLTTLRRPRP
ncbi:DUF397 domain-containing protein [Embleya sp. AB8]|uniref:DUF397 domain-containing protein n=1 Tax=Embleya sp. AB8 TaxID=3156304 RepID=UPI003C76781C